MTQAPVEYPDRPNREYETGKLGNGEEFQYHKVTEETAGTVNVPGGVRSVGVGDILIPGPSGDVFDVLDEKAFGELTSGNQEEPDTETETATGTSERRESDDSDSTEETSSSF
jgi:hypothetical protein